jgi:hypothetical protein
MRPEKWQRNAIFKAVEAGGLDLHECTFVYGDEGGRITHLPSASYFDLRGDVIRYVSTMVVGDDHERISRFSWVTAEERIRKWAKDVKRDVETPDLWAEIEREGEILTGLRYVGVENTPFTLDEQAHIAEQLERIKESAKTTYALSDAQMLALEAKLDEVKDASARLGRKDWVLLFGGVMLTVIVTGLLPPEAVQNILVAVLHALEHLFTSGGGPHLRPPSA